MDANLVRNIVTDVLEIVLDEYKAPEQRQEAADVIVKAVSPKHIQLETDFKQLLEQLQQVANSWRTQSDAGHTGFPPRKLALMGCASTIETIINKFKERKPNAEGDRRVAASSG